MRASVSISISSCLLAVVDAFIRSIRPTRAFITAKAENINKLQMADVFEISDNMPPSHSGLQANMKFKSILAGPSEIVQVCCKLPFGLDVAPKDKLQCAPRTVLAAKRFEMFCITIHNGTWAYQQEEGLLPQLLHSWVEDWAGNVDCSMF